MLGRDHLPNLVRPVLQCFECRSVRRVIHKAECLSAFVVIGSKGSELLAPCRVPNLESDFSSLALLIDVHSLGFKVLSQRCCLVVIKLIVDEARNQTCFAGGLVTQHHHLEGEGHTGFA